MRQLIRTISLKSGPLGPSAPLVVSPGSVTLFVGPNHSGKSKLLQEIRESIPRVEGTRFTKVVSALEFNPFEDTLRQKFESEFRRDSQDYDEGGVPHVRINKYGNTWQFT